MRTYLVGGAVRDALLGRPVQDRDWVVVGATPELMEARGFKPVGKDFPVFLHPRTGEEHALARTERKTGRGYNGFSVHAAPDVSLEQDLLRRDLTINAIAQDDDGTLIDPCGGIRDIEARVLRHVGPAFSEDPLRVLRVARFAARFADFSVATETMSLMRHMVASGELDELVAERRWQELARGLMEAAPSRMLSVLGDCGALDAVLPEIARPLSDPDCAGDALSLIDGCATREQPLAVRWACLLAQTLDPSGQAPADAAIHARALSERLKTPNECRDLAVLFVRERDNLQQALDQGAAAIVGLLERCDAFRRPERFALLLDCLVVSGANDTAKPAWLRALQAARSVDGARIARETSERSEIPARIRAARCAAVTIGLTQSGASSTRQPLEPQQRVK